MIAHDDVDLIRIQIFAAENVNSPAADPRKVAAQAAKPAPGSQVRVFIESPDQAEKWHPKENKDCAGGPDPQGANDTKHLGGGVTQCYQAPRLVFICGRRTARGRFSRLSSAVPQPG